MMRRKDREMTEELAWEVVDRCHFAVLSMTDEGGEPYGVAVNLCREGSSLYFHSAKEGRKIDCLRRNPQVCVTCVGEERVVAEQMTTEFTSAVAFGTAEEVTDPEEKIRVLQMLCVRYGTPMDHPAIKAEFAACLPPTAVWRIAVHRITGKAKRV